MRHCSGDALPVPFLAAVSGSRVSLVACRSRPVSVRRGSARDAVSSEMPQLSGSRAAGFACARSERRHNIQRVGGVSSLLHYYSRARRQHCERPAWRPAFIAASGDGAAVATPRASLTAPGRLAPRRHTRLVSRTSRTSVHRYFIG